MTERTIGRDLNRQMTSPLIFDWDCKFERDPTRLALDYWQSRRGARSMPDRSDLDPVAMRKFTQHVGLIDIRNAGEREIDYFIRRAGTKWEEVYGSITGHSIHEFLPPEIETSWREVFDAVRERSAPLRVRTGVDFQRKTWIETEMFVAPLGQSDLVSMLFMTFASWSGKRTA